jgi:ergothioneine biosynthesis protein EgtB
LARLIEIGINHEQQHQELLLTDILALFAANPLRPAYRARPRSVEPEPAAPGWIDFVGSVVKIGHNGEGFAWDNEAPRHDALVHPFRLADRPVTNGEWLEFMADGGYRTPAHWLSDGWTAVSREGWEAPLYWERHDGLWLAMSLEGFHPVERAAPVCHISYFEADAFARWAGKRLPTEFEWEVAAQGLPIAATGAPDVRPLPAQGPTGELRQMFGAVWQWTQSAYLPYPGYRPPAGALGEYNGKFMVSQQVLRGSSCATPPGHTRATYRNFFYPHQRWQFTGLRLASEVT